MLFINIFERTGSAFGEVGLKLDLQKNLIMSFSS